MDLSYVVQNLTDVSVALSLKSTVVKEVPEECQYIPVPSPLSTCSYHIWHPYAHTAFKHTLCLIHVSFMHTRIVVTFFSLVPDSNRALFMLILVLLEHPVVLHAHSHSQALTTHDNTITMIFKQKTPV